MLKMRDDKFKPAEALLPKVLVINYGVVLRVDVSIERNFLTSLIRKGGLPWAPPSPSQTISRSEDGNNVPQRTAYFFDATCYLLSYDDVRK